MHFFNSLSTTDGEFNSNSLGFDPYFVTDELGSYPSSTLTGELLDST
jgi:hypothetical protein